MPTAAFCDWVLTLPGDPFIEVVANVNGVLVRFSWLSVKGGRVLVQVEGKSSTTFAPDELKTDCPAWLEAELNEQ